MRFRVLILIAAAVALTACADARVSRPPTLTPAPLKTQRPTFTATPARPQATLAPTRPGAAAPVGQAAPAPTQAVVATPIPPAPTPIPPSPTPAPPSPTPEKASFTVSSPGASNVRSGPGTNYPRIGEVRQGQTYEITGKNQTGTWWQFSFDDRPAWISGELVSANTAAKDVQVAANIPAPPPVQPPPPPAAPPPTSPPPAPPSLFAQAGNELRHADNTNFNVVTFWGRLGPTGHNPISGYRLRVSAPSGNGETAFGNVWLNANPGLASEFRYNAKIELPRTSGGYRAVVVDGSGKEVSDVISGALNERTHDVILSWWPR